MTPWTITYQVTATRLPCSRNSPGKNTGVGCHFLLQGIFPTQGLNPGLLHCRWSLYHLSHQGSPIWIQKVLCKTVFFKSLLLLTHHSSHSFLYCCSCHNIVYILSVFSTGLIRQSCGPVSTGNMPHPNWETQKEGQFTKLPSLGAQTAKHPPAMQETRVQSLGREDPLEKEMEPTPVLLPGKFHGWRCLVGNSPWGHKELDTTERLHFPFLLPSSSLGTGKPQRMLGHLELIKPGGVMCQGLLHLRDTDRMTQPRRDRAGESTPHLSPLPHLVSARAPCWLRANARGQGAQGCAPQNCPSVQRPG